MRHVRGRALLVRGHQRDSERARALGARIGSGVVARQRITEIRKSMGKLIEGDELRERLAKIEA